MITLHNKFKSAFPIDSNEDRLFKSPIIVGFFLSYLSIVLKQYTINASLDSTIGITIIMTGQLLVYLFSDTIFKRRYWIYFVIQGIIIFNYVFITPKGYETIFLGLIPVLVFQSIIVYYEALKVIITSIFFYSIFCGTIIVFNGIKELIQYIPILLLITIAIRVYSIIFLEQVKLRIRTQKILQELEFAYEKVAELTLANERQRVARDLHDTLSQGLAGIIMQLEAVIANLNNNNPKRAQEILQKSMEHARKTLSDSRLVIDDLRSQATADIDFSMAVEKEITQSKAVSNISVAADIRVESQIPVQITKHIVYIVGEALNNIAKHAKAKNAVVKIIEAQNQVNISIVDDGIGFDVKVLDQQFGHYGILGMTERVRALNGKIKIKSKRKSGTNINITIPIEKGLNDENGKEKNIGSR